MTHKGLLLTSVIVLFLLVVACAPKVAPLAPAPTPTPAPTVSSPSASTPTRSPDDVAWANIIQAARKEGTVTAYSYNFVGDIGLAVSKAFEQKYGVKVEIVTGTGAAFLERMKAEKRMGQVAGDFTEGSVVNLFNMKTEGLLTPVYKDLPVVREQGVWNVEPMANDPQDKIILTESPTYFDPVINTSLVKPGTEPKSYQDLLDPKWQGKLSVADPLVGPGAFQWVVPLLDNGVINEDYLTALGKQKMRFYATVIDEMRAVAQGEVPMSVRGVDTAEAIIAKEGAPIQAVALKEGTVISTTGIVAITGGPHPNATRLFINWLMSQEGATVYGRAQGLAPTRKDVPDFRPEAVKAPDTRLIVVTPDEQLKAAQMMKDKWLSKFWGR